VFEVAAVKLNIYCDYVLATLSAFVEDKDIN